MEVREVVLRFRRKKREEQRRSAPITVEPSVICMALPMPVCIDFSKELEKRYR